MDLKGKLVAVTGGFGILGQAVGHAITAAGGRVALIDRAPSAKGEQPRNALLLGDVDLTSAHASAAAMDHIVSQTGRLDALVNIAGGFRWETLEGGSLDSWDFMYQINLRTTANSCKAALPHLIKSGAGRIVNIGAMGANKAAMGMGAYAASKAGVAKLTEALSEEVKDRGITVNAILPSMIDTPTNRADMPDADFSRWVPPQSIANVIVFLISDQASAVTGALIPVAGRV